jgi:lipopolysaccharide/colanic/teichoic acid biosynthesis glycosyltransferase
MTIEAPVRDPRRSRPRPDRSDRVSSGAALGSQAAAFQATDDNEPVQIAGPPLGTAPIVALALVALLWEGLILARIGPRVAWFTAPEPLSHLILTLACLGLVLWHSIRLRGSLDYKLGQAQLATGLVFGIYALAILAGRLFFSRPLMVSTAAETFLLSQGAVWLNHRLTPPRVALITPLLGGFRPAMPEAQHVTDPTTDLRAFDVALVSLNQQVSSEWARALARAMLAGCKVRHVGEFEEELRGAVSLDHFEIEHLSPTGLTSYRPLKRFMDVILVIFILPVALPLVAIAGLLILVLDGAPVFFTQERIGLGAGSFRIWKLRTMRVHHAGSRLDPTVPGDQRVTPLGRLLRRSRIDELPQLWNVLRGEMSLIGPRPEAASLHAEYLAEVPSYAYRYLVRPGITGWAQVCTTPSASIDEAQRKLTFDLYYIKHLSFTLDLKIALRTFWTIAAGSGVR